MIRACRQAIAVAMLGLVTLAGAPTTEAADLYRYGAGPDDAYDDPRYAYLYGREGRSLPPGWTQGTPGQRWRDRPYPPSRRVEGREDRWSERDCTPRRVVKARLERQGYYGFERARLVGRDQVEAEARHEQGGIYRIVIERCSGRLVEAQLLYRQRRYTRDNEPAPHAWRRPPEFRPYGRF